ncbi:MAG: hypothetical protein ACOC92_00715 [bacterium]
MPYQRLAIEVSPKFEKTRTFHSRLVGYLTADHLWDLGGSNENAPTRPVWLAVFSTPGLAKPFAANLRAGRVARTTRRHHGLRLQIPKSSPHRWTTQQVPGGIITVAYLPELLHLEPQMPFADEDVRFLLAPALRWVEAQAETLQGDFGPDAADAARAALFAAYLDRRTPMPLLRDLRFHLQLYRAALAEPWTYDATDPRCCAANLTRCGLDAPLVCHVSLDTLGDFLVRQTAEWHRAHPTVETPRRRRTLPPPAPAAQQLSLALGLP